MKQVGIVAGALIAVIAISNTIGGFVFQQAMVPITAEIQREIGLEAKARIDADDRMNLTMRQLSQDRITVLTLLTYPPGPGRDRMVRRLRAELISGINTP